MSHNAQILWVPADMEYKVICEDCGRTLMDGVDGIRFVIDGECEGLGETLDIDVSDGLGVDDIYGGVE